MRHRQCIPRVGGVIGTTGSTSNCREKFQKYTSRKETYIKLRFTPYRQPQTAHANILVHVFGFSKSHYIADKHTVSYQELELAKAVVIE